MYIEINLGNLEHNVRVLKKAIPPKCKLMAVVKAQAYGHGIYEISTHLEKIGVRAFAVATIDEGITLRKYGIRSEILILGYTSVYRASELKKFDLTQTLISFEYADALNKQGVMINAHVKIDTGMHRLGISNDDFLDVKKVFTMKNINVCGIFTHLCCSDSSVPDDVEFTKMQISGFYKLISDLKENGISIPKIHIQSSYGLFNYSELKCDYVRTGVALYGVKSLPDDSAKLRLDLRAVLSLKSRVILIRQIEKGDCVGYGRSFIAERDVNTTKTPAGNRQVPMLDFVKEAFLMEKERQEMFDLHCEVIIDGYSDFIFINRFGQAQHQSTLNKAIRRIIRDCNDEQLLKDENAEVLLPHFSCHSLRHTFTTRMCEAGVNVKVIQDALGHKDISTTLNIYTDVTKELKRSEFEGLDLYFKNE